MQYFTWKLEFIWPKKNKFWVTVAIPAAELYYKSTLLLVSFDVKKAVAWAQIEHTRIPAWGDYLSIS